MNRVAANVSSLISGGRSEPTHVGCYEGWFMTPMRIKKKWRLPMSLLHADSVLECGGKRLLLIRISLR